jgi:hypothetical protein
VGIWGRLRGMEKLGYMTTHTNMEMLKEEDVM